MPEPGGCAVHLHSCPRGKVFVTASQREPAPTFSDWRGGQSGSSGLVPQGVTLPEAGVTVYFPEEHRTLWSPYRLTCLQDHIILPPSKGKGEGDPFLFPAVFSWE